MEGENPAWLAPPADAPTNADLYALLSRIAGCCDEITARVREIARAENPEAVELAVLRAAEAQAAMHRVVAELEALRDRLRAQT